MNFPAPLLGLAIGDALGMPFETAPRSRPDLLDWDGRSFRNSDDYHGLNPGQWTDDTQMSLALSRTLIEHQQYVPEAAALAYRQWFEGDCRGIGGSTKRAMEKLCRGVPWTESGTPGAEGNGTAMRAAPFGAFYRYDPKLAGNMAVLDAGISHPTTEAREGSRAVAVAVALLCYGVGKTSMLPRVLEQVQASKVRSVLANLQCPESSVSPHVVETVNAAFFAFLNTANFSDAVEMAIRFGGDTDSVASITGALAGAHYGYMSLPKDLLGQLEGADEIHDLNLGLLE